MVCLAFGLGGAVATTLIGEISQRSVLRCEEKLTAVQFELGQTSALEQICRKMVQKIAEECQDVSLPGGPTKREM